MINKYEASITYDVNTKHPEYEEYDNKKDNVFKDVYTFDMDMYGGNPIEYMKYDLKLVAGGGYEYDGIDNARIKIIRVQD